MKKDETKAKKKVIEIETDYGNVKLDTGNKWLDGALFVIGIIFVASILIGLFVLK